MGDVNPVMMTPILLGLAIIFVSVAVRDFLRAENKLSPARNTWLRIAMIFSAISIVLFFVNSFTR